MDNGKRVEGISCNVVRNDQRIASSVIEFVSSASVLQEWPEVRQLLLQHLDGEPAWNLALPILSCQAVGGDQDSAVPVAAAWSTLHYAALIFDAVQDDHERSVALGPPDRAISFATALMFSAYHFLSSIPNLEAAQKAGILFSEAGFHSSLGQYTGMVQTYEDPSVRNALETYWQVVISKSGSIFRAAVGGGAVVGTRSWDRVNAMGEFGTALGVMLQVIDDCRDVLSNNSSATDKNHEFSLPLLLYQAATTQKNGELLAPLSIPTDRKALFDLLQGTNVIHVIVNILQEWRQRALNSLTCLEKSDARTRLEAILDLTWEPKSIVRGKGNHDLF